MRKSANGVEGHLIYTGDHKYYFRVYDADGGFTDYDIAHSDLCVTITDEDATFYHENSRTILDHAPSTLGLKHE